MDSSRPQRPRQPVFDVINPGAGANPSGRPVIVSNQPQQVDPMMAPVKVPDVGLAIEPAVNLPPSPPIAEPQPQSPQPSPQPVTALASEPLHTLQSPGALFGEVHRRPSGKKVLIFLVSCALLGVLGVVGWWYWKAQMNNGKSTKAPAKIEVAQPAADKTIDKTFASKIGVFSLSNEYDWNVQQADLTDTFQAAGQAGAKYGKISFAINDKQSLVFDINPGGKGGSCTPKATEKAFTKGNSCSSFEITKSEKLSLTKLPLELLGTGTVTPYLVTYKYMGTDDTKPYTLVGIQATTKGLDGKETVIAHNTPVMEAFMPYSVLALKNGYLEIKIVGTDNKPTQLSNDDLEKVGIVLKTLKLTPIQ